MRVLMCNRFLCAFRRTSIKRIAAHFVRCDNIDKFLALCCCKDMNTLDMAFWHDHYMISNIAAIPYAIGKIIPSNPKIRKLLFDLWVRRGKLAKITANPRCFCLLALQRVAFFSFACPINLLLPLVCVLTFYNICTTIALFCYINHYFSYTLLYQHAKACS